MAALSPYSTFTKATAVCTREPWEDPLAALSPYSSFTKATAVYTREPWEGPLWVSVNGSPGGGRCCKNTTEQNRLRNMFHSTLHCVHYVQYISRLYSLTAASTLLEEKKTISFLSFWPQGEVSLSTLRFTAVLYNVYGSKSGSKLDPYSGTLWIRIRIHTKKDKLEAKGVRLKTTTSPFRDLTA